MGTLPNLTLHYGRFSLHRVRMRRVSNPEKKVAVWKAEEKGSDVNLACKMLEDGMDGAYEAAVVISNDTDLEWPIRTVRKRFGLPVVVIFPVCQGRRKPAANLRKVASKSIILDQEWLAVSQFPNPLIDARGEFTKPPGW